MSFFTHDILSMILVGALWGCTNPLIRKGSVEASTSSSTISGESTSTSFLSSSLRSFLNVTVWLPYVLNQSGSLVFYILLANSNLSMAVPVCNAMALVFSFGTSFLLGEPIDKPFHTALGASLVLVGVTICVSSSQESTSWKLSNIKPLVGMQWMFLLIVGCDDYSIVCRRRENRVVGCPTVPIPGSRVWSRAYSTIHSIIQFSTYRTITLGGQWCY